MSGLSPESGWPPSGLSAPPGGEEELWIEIAISFLTAVKKVFLSHCPSNKKLGGIVVAVVIKTRKNGHGCHPELQMAQLHATEVQLAARERWRKWEGGGAASSPLYFL